ncbi:MAG: glycoside hydrolase family 5 protein [Lachnospiraceae bacterium]|nr:glycoside hydrolase family 5 protein [Lachnospiraceae bacterium]
MWKPVSKCIAFSILLTGILCISGCGNSAVEAESEISIIEAEITEKATDVAEDNPSEITAGENRLEESMEESASKSENKEEHSMGEASKGYMDVPSGDEEGSQGREQTAGQLSVEGTKLVDAAGNPVQLRGISTHGLAWYPSYVNEACFRQLKEEWGANVIRLAMYTAENGGYCTDGDREELKALIKGGVEYAANNDMYVIIDWHVLSDGNPNQYLEESLAFFGEMSEAYAGYTNVLYEICNEPNGNVSWGEIKSYAEQVIEVIRGNDKEGVILVGTPNWSQYVDQAAADPIQGYDNIMYTLHFYAATHTDSLRDTMVKAVESGLPVFVSEYGICDASGNGAINAEQADRWIEVMDSHNISYVAWNLSNKAETSAILKSNCEKTESFSVEDLSDSGKWLYGMLREGRDAASVGENSRSWSDSGQVK